MVDKYQYMIAKKIGKYNLGYMYDDLFQEGLMILHKSLTSYDPSYGKTFTRYFEMNYERRLITIMKKKTRQKQITSESEHVLAERMVLNEHRPRHRYRISEVTEAVDRLSPFERTVFRHRVGGKLKPAEIAEKEGCAVKKVYNAIERMKKKIKNHLM